MNAHPIHMPWASEEKERAIALDLKGWTASQIANAVSVEFGTRRTRNAVIGLINRSGVRERREARAPSRRAPAPPKPAERAIQPVSEVASAVSIFSSPSLPDVRQEAEAASDISGDDGDISFKGVPLYNLEKVHCRNVIRERPYLFCGRPTVFQTSWCGECAPRMFTAEGYARLKAGKKPPVNMAGIR